MYSAYNSQNLSYLDESDEYKPCEVNSTKRMNKRLARQEKRLYEKNLKYDTKETYNEKTKRTSRVLICLHPGCNKEFKKTRNLIIHSRVHTNERPHVCQFCNKGFTQQCNLKKHLELHMNGKFKPSKKELFGNTD